MSEHKLTITIQPIADALVAECSCGKWRESGAYYAYDAAVAKLKISHRQHAAENQEVS